jgi:hypothetical protein
MKAGVPHSSSENGADWCVTPGGAWPAKGAARALLEQTA